MIEEIPIDVSEEALPEPDDVPAEPLSTIEEEAPAPKKRGRPAGAKNKPKSKIVAAPKAAKKPKRTPPPPPSDDESEEEEDEEEPTPPPPLRRTRSRAAPASEYEEEVVDARSVAAEMLQMLSQRNANRNQAKRNKYASWFPNNAVY